MKNLSTLVMWACFILCSYAAAAQTDKYVLNEPDLNKPRLFNDLPEVIPVSIDNLNTLIQSKPGANISTTLSHDARTAPFEGQVVSAASKSQDRVQTIMIRSTNYPGASLYISRVIKDDGSVKYNGRLMSFQHGDLFVLQPKDEGFVLVKKNFYDLVNE